MSNRALKETAKNYIIKTFGGKVCSSEWPGKIGLFHAPFCERIRLDIKILYLHFLTGNRDGGCFLKKPIVPFISLLSSVHSSRVQIGNGTINLCIFLWEKVNLHWMTYGIPSPIEIVFTLDLPTSPVVVTLSTIVWYLSSWFPVKILQCIMYFFASHSFGIARNFVCSTWCAKLSMNNRECENVTLVGMRHIV